MHCFTARWKAALRARRQGDDSGRVEIWSQSGFIGSVCEYNSNMQEGHWFNMCSNSWGTQTAGSWFCAKLLMQRPLKWAEFSALSAEAAGFVFLENVSNKSTLSNKFTGNLFSNCRIIPLKTKKPQSASQNQYESASFQDVLHRHPLYLIVRMMCYDDGLGAGKNLLALKTTDANQEECSIWVYQCSSSVSRQWKKFKRRTSQVWGHLLCQWMLSVFHHLCKQEQAQSICKVLSASFDCVLTSEKSWGRRDGGWLRRKQKPAWAATREMVGIGTWCWTYSYESYLM